LPGGAVLASWYGPEHHGRITASGQPFDERQLTAAHPRLPLHMLVRVTNILNGRTVEVRITDRGPGYGRGIDLSQAAAKVLGMEQCGLAPVRLALADAER
jgi:rare lipoprotein A